MVNVSLALIWTSSFHIFPESWQNQALHSLHNIRQFLPTWTDTVFNSENTSILMLRHDYDGSNSYFFYQPWADYKDGFGNITSLYWIGLDSLHDVSKFETCRIRSIFNFCLTETGISLNIHISRSLVHLIITDCQLMDIPGISTMGWHTTMVNNSLRTTWITIVLHTIVHPKLGEDSGITTVSM